MKQSGNRFWFYAPNSFILNNKCDKTRVLHNNFQLFPRFPVNIPLCVKAASIVLTSPTWASCWMSGGGQLLRLWWVGLRLPSLSRLRVNCQGSWLCLIFCVASCKSTMGMSVVMRGTSIPIRISRLPLVVRGWHAQVTLLPLPVEEGPRSRRSHWPFCFFLVCCRIGRVWWWGFHCWGEILEWWY